MADNNNINDNDLNKSLKGDIQVLSFLSQEEWEKWMVKNYNLINGVWIRFYKKKSGVASITYDEALDVALCYGWIDGLVNKYDELSYIQKFTPRRSKSMWSKRNIEHVTRLEKEDRMKPSGINEMEKAMKDGRWERAYDSPENMTVPEDFMLELSKNAKALKFFESLNKANKYAIGWRLQTATNAASRLKRMNEILIMMEKGEKFH